MTVRPVAVACALTLLTACGTDQTPVGSSASSTPAAPVTISPGSPATPRVSDPATLEVQVKTATTIFMQSAFTLGYPDDRDLETYLVRIRPMLSAHGYAQEVSLYEGDPSVSATIKGYYAHHQRATLTLTSDPTITHADPASARTSVKYHLLLQQQDEGKWRTTRTTAEKTETVSLVHEGGRWLVDEIR